MTTRRDNVLGCCQGVLFWTSQTTCAAKSPALPELWGTLAVREKARRALCMITHAALFSGRLSCSRARSVQFVPWHIRIPKKAWLPKFFGWEAMDDLVLATYVKAPRPENDCDAHYVPTDLREHGHTFVPFHWTEVNQIFISVS